MALSGSLYSKAGGISGRWAPGKELALQACVGGLYFIAGKLGLSLATAHSFITPIWPAAGVALAALMLLGYGFWPGLLAGSFLLNLTIFSGPEIHLLTLISASLSIASGNILAAVAGTWLVENYAKGRDALLQPHTILLFVALAGVASTALDATSAVVVCRLVRFADSAHPGDLWFSWWLADMVGVVLFAPLILAWATKRQPAFHPPRILEATALFGFLLLSCWITFGGWPGAQPRLAASSFLIVPILLWTAFRFGQRGTTSVTFVVGCLATIGTLRGHGPFAVANRDASLLLLQDFLGGLAVMLLLLSADIEQRRRSDTGLRASEQRYRQLFENNPQPSWVFDRQTMQFLAVNPAALDHYGYSQEEFLSMRLPELWAEGKPFKTKNPGQEPEQPAGPTVCHRKKDGTLMEVEVTQNDLTLDGRRAGLLLVEDVTERKRAERQAAAFSELGRSLSAASSPQAAAEKIFETAAALLGSDGGSLDLCPTGSDPWRNIYRLGTGGEDQAAEPSAAQLPNELRKRVLENGPQLILHPETPQLENARSRANQALPLSQMFVPVRKEESIIGILSVQSLRANAYGQADLRTLQALADHCGGALDRMRTATALRESDERLKLALAASRMGIWTLELKKPVRMLAGPELEAMLGLAPGEFDHSEKSLFDLIHPQDHALVRRAIGRAIKIEGDYEVEFRVLPRNRPSGWLLARGRAVLGPQGEPVRLTGVAIDITAQKQAQQEVLRLNAELERRVNERTSQLEAINRELEAFSYSVSHDLRAPLRSVRGFCQVLLDRYESSLDARGREFLRRAAESSQHMDTLIEDLLQLSRISRAELRPRPVNLSALAESIAGELHQAEPQREVKFLIAPGLLASGEERLVRLVLENLMRNAWKFTAKQPSARIEFGHAAGPPAAFFVRDNGAGFDMKYVDRLFGVFQRLHTTTEFPGTGVGLATVQRILNRHGGRAWAEGAPQRGATFYFTLPPHEGL